MLNNRIQKIITKIDKKEPVTRTELEIIKVIANSEINEWKSFLENIETLIEKL